MNWIKLSDRRPLANHCYHWKTNLDGGWCLFDGLDFDDKETWDLVDSEIFWLDEEAPDVELTVGVLKGVAKKWHTHNLEAMQTGGSFISFDQIIIDKIKELENGK